VLTIVILIPAIDVGSFTPAPDATVDTTLNSFVRTVALPCAVPAAEIAVPTETIA
jgi:hypothetical protein